MYDRGDREIDVRPSAGELVEITRRALDTAIGELAASSGLAGVQVLLADFVAAISPVQRSLDVLAGLESIGLAATAIIHLVNASTQFDVGDVAAGWAAIEAAYVAFQDGSSEDG